MAVDKFISAGHDTTKYDKDCSHIQKKQCLQPAEHSVSEWKVRSKAKDYCSCEKNHFLFSDQVKKMSQGQSGKYGPKNPIWAKNGIFLHSQKTESDFLVKEFTFDFLFK